MCLLTTYLQIQIPQLHSKNVIDNDSFYNVYDVKWQES